MPAVNKRLISGVAGQRAMFASKPSRTEAAPELCPSDKGPRSHGQLPAMFQDSTDEAEAKTKKWSKSGLL